MLNILPNICLSQTANESRGRFAQGVAITTERGKSAQQCKANANLLLLAKLNQARVILFLSLSEEKFVRWTEVSDGKDRGTISGKHKEVCKINMVRNGSSARKGYIPI